MPELRVRLLGGFSVAVGGRTIAETEWRRRKVASLIKLLALAGGRLHRDQLVDRLWPDLTPEAAVNNLYQALHLARRIFDPTGATAANYLQIQSDLVHLCLAGPVWIDVAAFETAAGVAQQSQDLAAYRAALDLYVGDLLPEDPYEEWASNRREVLRQGYLGLLLDQARLQEARHEYAEAIQTLNRVVERDAVHEDAHVRLMRLYALRGQRQQALRQYQMLEERLRVDLAAEPDPRSQRLYRAILEGRFPGPERTSAPRPSQPREPQKEVPHNLPLQLTRFIGREREKGDVRRLLETTRLLTLTGPGGCGKTRLALEVGAAVRERYPDGAWLVELAPLGDHTQVPLVVAEALDVPETSSRPVMETLVTYLKARQVLVILDNCEHLLDACAHVTNVLLRACPGLRIVTTSREPLHVPGEVTWLVPSLSLPDPQRDVPVDALLHSEAVQLFVDRAAAAKPGFQITEQNARAVAQVCYRLDGMPLAIELAAARVKVLSVSQIAERLNDCFRLLSGGTRVGLTRQQTLKATLEWSHDLLAESERVVFRRLAVFAGGFDLEAAEVVCSTPGSLPDAAMRRDPHPPASPPRRFAPSGLGMGGGVERDDVLDLLSRLVDKSLVVVEMPDGDARYRLLEPIRQYTAAQLEAAGEEAVIRGRHRDHYLALAEASEPKLHTGEQVAWLDRLEREHDNLRAALFWSHAEHPGGEIELRLAGALFRYWALRGYLSEGRGWLKEALRRADEVRPSEDDVHREAFLRARAKALHAAGALAAFQADLVDGEALLEESIAISRALGDRRGAAYAAVNLAYSRFRRGDYARARAEIEQCIATFRELGDTWALSEALQALGDILLEAEPGAARPFLEESLVLARQTGDPYVIATALTSLGYAALHVGDAVAARAFVEEGLRLRRETGQRWYLAISLASLGDVARYEGDYDEAEALYQEALDRSRDMGVKHDIAWALHNLGHVAKTLGDRERARTLFDDSLAIELELGDRSRIARCLVGLAGVAVAHAKEDGRRDEAERATRLFGAAQTLLEAVGARLAPANQAEHDRDVSAARAMLGQEAFARAWEEGRRQESSAAVDDARRRDEPRDEMPRLDARGVERVEVRDT